jgi:hypothetical protein
MPYLARQVLRGALVVVLAEAALHLASYVHLGATAVLVVVIAIVTSSSSVKARATKTRVDNLVGAVGSTKTAVAAVTSQAGTVNTGTQPTFDDGPTGEPSANDYGLQSSGVDTSTNGGVSATTGGASTGTAHTHAYGHVHELNFYLPTAAHTHDTDVGGTVNNLIAMCNGMYSALKAAGLI